MIKVKSIALIFNEDKLLVTKYEEPNRTYFRPPGGSIQKGENSRTALEREIQEEFNASVMNVQYQGVYENIYTTDQLYHEIMLLYTCDFIDQTLYNRNIIQSFEEGSGQYFENYWITLDELRLRRKQLLPYEILAYLTQ